MNPRVALIVDELDIRQGTGIARYSIGLAEGLAKEGIEVKVISTKTPSLPYGSALNHLAILPSEVLRRVDRFDLVHATAPIAALSFPLVRKKRIVTFHDLVSIVCPQAKAAPHARLTLPALFRMVARSCDRIIAVSTQTKDELVSYLGVQSEKVVVINLGIDDEFMPLRRAPRKEFFIGYLGALAPRKRIDYALRAFKVLRRMRPDLDVKFRICGARDRGYQKLRDLIRELKVDDNVEFLDFVPDNKIVEFYNSLDVLVFPSEWEGFGIPILEAQRCGVPVVIRSDSHIPPEVSRFALKADSEEDMAGRILELLTMPALRNERSKIALEYSRQFSWEKTARETLDVYERVFQDRNGSVPGK